MQHDLTQLFRSFVLLARDYEELLEYVHPSHSNLRVYSHRIFSLLLRACTDFESLSKAAYKYLGLTYNEKNAPIGSFGSLPEKLKVTELEVEILSFQPGSLIVAPLDGWAESPHRLTWYRAYNEVKHNRVDSFREASLENLTRALSACFLLLVGANAIPAIEYFVDEIPDGRKRVNFHVGPFAVIAPRDWNAPSYWRD